MSCLKYNVKLTYFTKTWGNGNLDGIQCIVNVGKEFLWWNVQKKIPDKYFYWKGISMYYALFPKRKWKSYYFQGFERVLYTPSNFGWNCKIWKKSLVVC